MRSLTICGFVPSCRPNMDDINTNWGLNAPVTMTMTMTMTIFIQNCNTFKGLHLKSYMYI